MTQRRSLSPAQLRFFKVSPRNLLLSRSPAAIQLLQESLIGGSCNSSLSRSKQCQLDVNKISKNTTGNFEPTVRNFGVLINKNFGNESAEHQVQKFGGRIKNLNHFMNQQGRLKQNSHNILDERIRVISDPRVSLSTTASFMGVDFQLCLKSFELNSIDCKEANLLLPLQYLRLLTEHVSSPNLVDQVSYSIKTEGNNLVVDYDKMLSKVSGLTNNEQAYRDKEYAFSKYGHQLVLKAPMLEIWSADADYRQENLVSNRDIVQILKVEFINASKILEKYVNKQLLEDANTKKEQGV